MTTGCYYLSLDSETAIAIQTISLSVPCFITLKTIEPLYGEYTITARSEDWAFIEKILAKIV